MCFFVIVIKAKAQHTNKIQFTTGLSKFHFKKNLQNVCFVVFTLLYFSQEKTALDKARDNNHKDVALLLARDPQVSVKIKQT